MRKTFRILGQILGWIILIIGLIYWFMYFTSMPYRDWDNALSAENALIGGLIGVVLVSGGLLLSAATRGETKRTRTEWFSVGDELTIDNRPRAPLSIAMRIVLYIVAIIAIVIGGLSDLYFYFIVPGYDPNIPEWAYNYNGWGGLFFSSLSFGLGVGCWFMARKGGLRDSSNMQKPISHFTYWEKLRIHRILIPVVDRYGGYSNAMRNPIAIVAVVKYLEYLTQEKPEDFFLWYLVSEFSNDACDYQKALAAAEQCLALDSSSVRAMYSLGTVYFQLAQVKLKDDPRVRSYNEAMRKQNPARGRGVDFNIAEATLIKMGMTTQEAAENASKWFSMTRASVSRTREKQHLDFLISGLNHAFPELLKST